MTGEHAAQDAAAIAAVFARVARELATSDGETETLEAITRLAAETIDHCDHAGISLIAKGGRIETKASTDEVVRRLDEAEAETGEGPCLDALREHESVRVDDLSSDERWPAFAARARGEGIGSVHSFRLFVEDDTVGALNLYAHATHAFSDSDQALGEAFAAHAAIAFAHAREEAGLRAAVETRGVIGQAQGILMERGQMTPSQAFGALRRVSQDRNIKLVQVAEQVVRTGRLPPVA